MFSSDSLRLDEKNFSQIDFVTLVITLFRKKKLHESLSSDTKRRARKTKFSKFSKSSKSAQNSDARKEISHRNDEKKKDEKKEEKKKKKRDSNESDINDRKWRILNRRIKWQTLLFDSNEYANDLIFSVFDRNIDEDSNLYLNAKVKIFDNVKIYKNQMLARMKIFIFSSFRKISHFNRSKIHIKKQMKADVNFVQHDLNYMLMDHFKKSFNSSNFFYVFKYMNDYLNFNQNFELRKFYMQNKFNTIKQNFLSR